MGLVFGFFMVLAMKLACVEGRDNIGLEFIIGFLDNDATGSSLDLELFVTTLSDSPATVTVTAPSYDATLSRSTVVNRGDVSKISLPSGLRGVGSSRENKGVLIQSTQEITVYAVNKEQYSTDAFLALPVEGLGNKYYVITYKTDPEMMFVGTADNTDIFITLSLPTPVSISIVFESVTYISGDVLKLRINRFETVHFHQAGNNADFTGTYVFANQPVAVFAGNRKIPVPVMAGSSDHLVEQSTPVSTWGQEFVYVSTPDRTTGDLVRILASEASTIITISGIGSITITSAGEFIELDIASGEVKYITSFKPVVVTVFSKTDPGTEANGGDPSMYVLTPISQYTYNYVFSTVETPSGNFTNYLTLVVNGNQTSGLKLDNSAIDGLGITWSTVPDSAGLVSGTIAIPPGSHNVFHDNPTIVFFALCTGVAPYNSYSFASGMRLARINEPCSTSSQSPGDEVDNDCDGRIDEEESNGVDDDGDGSVDEDLSVPRRVDGGFSQWTVWSTCTSSCGTNGTISRNRICNNPAPVHSGLPCSGDLSATEICLPALPDCPIDGNWTAWTQWSACSVTCENGNETRSRSCTNPAPQFNGLDCTGDAEEAVPCNAGVLCPINGEWGLWSSWSACSVTCSSGTRDRSRSCDSPAAANGGNDCPGGNNETEICNTGVNCPIDGGFETGANWSACSVTCGNGSSIRQRDCSNPTPQFGGANCTGDYEETEVCDTGLRCPVQGGWGTWSVKSACSVTCGGGSSVRYRHCNNPVPEPGGECVGKSLDAEHCNAIPCRHSHTNTTCSEGWFPCRDGSACIHFLQRCDCFYTCADGSDESEEYGRCVPGIRQCTFKSSAASCVSFFCIHFSFVLYLIDLKLVYTLK